MGRTWGPCRCRPTGWHGGQRQASWWGWRQRLRQWWPWGQTIHQWGWWPLHPGRPSREAWRGWRLFHLKVELKKELLGFPVPVSPKLALGLVNLSAWHLEGDGLVGLSSHQQVLPAPVWGLDPLLVGRHEAVAWHDPVSDLRIVDLEEEALLAHLRVPLLGHFIARAADLHKLLHFHLDLLWCWLGGGLLSLFGCSPGQVGLVLFPLGMREVAPLIVVECQAQLAFIRAQVVLHEIRVLVDVDGLQGQLPEALPPVPVALGRGGHASTPGLAPRAMLEVHGEGLEALLDWRDTCTQGRDPVAFPPATATTTSFSAQARPPC